VTCVCLNDICVNCIPCRHICWPDGHHNSTYANNTLATSVPVLDMLATMLYIDFLELNKSTENPMLSVVPIDHNKAKRHKMLQNKILVVRSFLYMSPVHSSGSLICINLTPSRLFSFAIISIPNSCTGLPGRHLFSGAHLCHLLPWVLHGTSIVCIDGCLQLGATCSLYHRRFHCIQKILADRVGIVWVWVSLLFVYVTYSNASWAECNLVQRDLFDARFQLLALDRPDDERTAAFVDALRTSSRARTRVGSRHGNVRSTLQRTLIEPS